MCVRTKKHISTEIRGLFMIILMFMSIRAKVTNNTRFLDLICAGFCSTILCTGYFFHYNLTFLIFLTIDARGSMKLIQEKSFIVFWSKGSITEVSTVTINDISQTVLKWGLEFRSASCMFDLVSTMPNFFLVWISWRAVISKPRGLDRVVILSYSTLLISAWLYSYSFDGGPMG